MGNELQESAAERTGIAQGVLPFEGMKIEPYGWPLMAGAYMGLLYWVAGQPEARQAFKAETGHNLDRVLWGRGMAQMVDKATGYDKAVVASFADWVTVNYWGDGEVPDDAEP